VALKKIKLDSK